MKKLLTSLSLFAFLNGTAQNSFTVYFDFDKYALTQTGRSQLDSFIQTQQKTVTGSIIHLDGHCDNKGSDAYNDKLSKQRVGTVKNYLVANGVQAEIIVNETGHGEKELLNENQTGEERQLNRRVVVSLHSVVTTALPGSGTLKEKLADSSLTAGSKLVLQNINFIGGLHQFLPSSKPMLDELLEAMNSYPTLVIRIEGHICCTEYAGDGMDNETGINNLSAARAKAIQDHLIANGIAAERVSYKGFGHSAPIFPFPEKTEEERTMNRRVEIKIIRR